VKFIDELVNQSLKRVYAWNLGIELVITVSICN